MRLNRLGWVGVALLAIEFERPRCGNMLSTPGGMVTCAKKRHGHGEDCTAWVDAVPVRWLVQW